DGAWVARRGADGRGQFGRSGPHAAGARAGDPEPAPTRREPCRAPPVAARPVATLRVQPLWRTSAGGRSQAADPARRGSGGRVYPVASAPAVPAIVPESVPCLATAPARVRLTIS